MFAFRLRLAAVMAALAVGAGVACAQGRFTPGLVLDTPGRTASCDALQFTRDGKQLLAAGDDKVVRRWQVEAARLVAEPPLRWSLFREQRGNIYALALSPDEQLVAVAGFGVRIGGTVALLNRGNGEVVEVAELPSFQVIRALTFSPSGKALAIGQDDGSVWYWARGRARPVRLGQHRFRQQRDPYDRVRLVAFRDEGRLLSVAEDGLVKEWDVRRPGEPGEDVVRFGVAPGARGLAWATVSADGRMMAAGGDSGWVDVLALDGSSRQRITLAERQTAYSLAFDRAGRQLAVGTRTYVADSVGFLYETDFQVQVYTLGGDRPRRTAVLPATYYPDAVAFHPDGVRLAVAGGANHEVTLWRLEGERPVRLTEAVSPGSCLWSVGLSEDGRHVGFREQRNPTPHHVADYGIGPWRVFDLRDRRWTARSADFKPVPPILTHPQWRVRAARTFEWHVIDPDGTSYLLPFDRNIEMTPRCYSFLPSEKGKPVRLAIGHLNGFSVFELRPGQEPKRVRLCIGHEGEVMALAPSSDGQVLVTASRDQTIAGWRLRPWDSHPELGASFDRTPAGTVVVRKVDAGSPAWDANAQQGKYRILPSGKCSDTGTGGTPAPRLDGLQEDDEVVLFAFNVSEFLYDPLGLARDRHGRVENLSDSAAECLARLRRPEPGKQFYFVVRRKVGKEDQLVELQTTVRQRPLWRFFPMRDNEWVLWRWRDFYYDTSTHGDRSIGWVVCGDVQETPRFLRAEQMRDKFHKPAKLARVLPPNDDPPERLVFAELEPPQLRVTAPPAATVTDTGVRIGLSARARPGDNQKLQRVALWINDYRLPAADIPPLPADGLSYDAVLQVPEKYLAQGENVLTLQVFNEARGRAEQQFRVQFTSTKRARTSVLHGLVVGINNYDTVKGLQAEGGGSLSLRYARADALAIRQVLERQAGGELFREVRVRSPLLDRQATKDAILGELRALAGEVKVDDRLVLFLAGHGVPVNEDRPDSFVFVVPFTDARGGGLERTGLTGEELMKALAEVPCRKVLLLDACHSGGVLKNNVIRSLLHEGVGASILTACDPQQAAWEMELTQHGIFTQSILDATGRLFDQADSQVRDGRLEFVEFSEFVARRAAMLARDQGEAQTPQFSPPTLREPLFLFQGKK